MKKLIKVIVILILLWLLYMVVCMVIPPLFQKPAAAGEPAAPCQENSEAQERVLCIDNNMDALLWRLRLIEAARERLVLATFDFRDDHSGQDIMAALLNAADRGVQVQILVDGFNGLPVAAGQQEFSGAGGP